MIDMVPERAQGLWIRLAGLDSGNAQLTDRAERGLLGPVLRSWERSEELRRGEDGEGDVEDDDDVEFDSLNWALLGPMITLCGRDDLMVMLCGLSSITTLGRDVS